MLKIMCVLQTHEIKTVQNLLCLIKRLWSVALHKFSLTCSYYSHNFCKLIIIVLARHIFMSHELNLAQIDTHTENTYSRYFVLLLFQSCRCRPADDLCSCEAEERESVLTVRKLHVTVSQGLMLLVQLTGWPSSSNASHLNTEAACCRNSTKTCANFLNAFSHEMQIYNNYYTTALLNIEQV